MRNCQIAHVRTHAPYQSLRFFVPLCSKNIWINVRFLGAPNTKNGTRSTPKPITECETIPHSRKVEASPAPSLAEVLSVCFSKSLNFSVFHSVCCSFSFSFDFSLSRAPRVLLSSWVRAKIVEGSSIRFVSCLALSAELHYLTHGDSCCCWFWSIVCACVTNRRGDESWVRGS